MGKLLSVEAVECGKYSLTGMELDVLLFLANNPQYDTAAQIVELRHLAKSHVSVSVRSLRERGLLSAEYCGSDRRTLHLRPSDDAQAIVADGRTAQEKFALIFFDGFSESENEMMDSYLQRIFDNINSNIKKR